ncbi:MAG: peptide chain release factor N(5)-glutamine methyltransferase [Dehalococcoidales bacterium]|nr:peptide chain release factor N(5)-glutamine methyltransferase [Dehalococcoidales bacterium]
MRIREALEQARKNLSDNKIEDAALEAEVLLRYVLNVERTFLFTCPDKELTSDEHRKFMGLINRRTKGEPTAYITGTREFYGLDFKVNPSVLIPRPETELLVDTTIQAVNEFSYKTIADIGTGSGCIAVSLAVNLPAIKIYATDISSSALETACKNAELHDVSGRITFLEGNLLVPLPEKIDIIVANLPYITQADLPSVNTLDYEPESALHGGANGLVEIFNLISQSKEYLTPGGTLLLETGQGQGEAVCDYIMQIHPLEIPQIYNDLAGIDRVVRLTLSQNSRSFS